MTQAGTDLDSLVVLVDYYVVLVRALKTLLSSCCPTSLQSWFGLQNAMESFIDPIMHTGIVGIGNTTLRLNAVLSVLL